MPKFGAQIDTMRIPIKGLIAEQGTSAPSSPVEGLMWHDTALKQVKVYLNGAWVQIDNVAGGTASNVTDGDKGVITVTGGVWSLDANTVTTSHILDGTVAIADLNTASVRLDTVGAPTGSVAMNNQRITGMADGTAATDAVTRQQLDSVSAGLDAKASVLAATTANITLTGLQTVDGVGLGVGDRVLVKNQTTAAQNGIYVVASGAWTRAVDLDSWAEVPGAYVFVEQSTGTQADTGWVCTSEQGGTLGVTPIVWTQFTGAGSITAGAGLTKSGNTISVATDGITNAMIADGAINLATADVTGTLPLTKGGTGGTDAATARASLAAVGKFTRADATPTVGSYVTVAHNLNSSSPTVQFDEQGGQGPIFLDWNTIDANNIRYKADAALNAAGVRVTVFA